MRRPPGDPPPSGRGGPQRIPRPPGVRRGGPPPWADLAAEERRFTVADVHTAFQQARAPRRPPVERLIGVHRASAVLAPFYEEDGELVVVLTRRARHLRAHSWEISFPGGRQHHGEELTHTALREAEEEIALPSHVVEIVGELDHLATVSSASSIVPYVGVLAHRPPLVPDPGEVEAVLDVPVAELLDPGIFREERWNLPTINRPIYFFELEGDTLWGATAAMLVDFLGRLTGTAPTPGL